MSFPVLLKLLNEFGKRDKMRGLRGILSLFHNEFYQFNNIGVRIFIFNLSYDIKIALQSHF